MSTQPRLGAQAYYSAKFRARIPASGLLVGLRGDREYELKASRLSSRAQYGIFHRSEKRPVDSQLPYSLWICKLSKERVKPFARRRKSLLQIIVHKLVPRLDGLAKGNLGLLIGCFHLIPPRFVDYAINQ